MEDRVCISSTEPLLVILGNSVGPAHVVLFCSFAIVCRKPKMTHWRTLDKSLSQVRTQLTPHNHFLRKIQVTY